MPQSFTLGVDIGGTKIEIALVDQDGNIVEQTRILTDVAGGVSKIVKDIAAASAPLIAKSRIPPKAVGVGVAGQIQPETGVVRFGPNLHWVDIPLKEELQKNLHLPVFITNDVRAAGWGEWLYGAGENSDDIVCLFIGTGVGGAIVSGGRMLRGGNNSAGELGHITLEINGPQCTCGNRGCLEAFAGGWALGRSARAAVENDRKSGTVLLEYAQGKLDKITAREVLQAAAKGDSLSKGLVDEMIEAISAATVGLVNAFNPSRFIFGGGLGLAIPDLIPRVESELRRHALKAATEQLQVVPARLGENAGAVGAAAYAMREVNER